MTQLPDDPSTKPEPYKTSDTPYAAYLHYRGHKLVTTRQDPNDYKREVLVFIYSEEIPKLEQEWRYGEAHGDLKKYQKSLKIVSRYVNEARKQRDQ
jgi:hypothetical protein